MGKVKRSSSFAAKSRTTTTTSTKKPNSAACKTSKQLDVPVAETFSSPYVGVWRVERLNFWTSRISIMKNGAHHKHHVGNFDTAIEAAKAYDVLAAKLGRPVNFPTEPGQKKATKRRKGVENLPDIIGKRRSRYVGVFWDKGTKMWGAHIAMIKNKKQYAQRIGSYLDEEEAARAFDREAIALGRAVNFPKKGQKQAVKQRELASIPNRDKWSPFVGVFWDTRRKLFASQFMDRISKRQVAIGFFDDEIEAARAYDKKAIEHGKPVNFPLHAGMKKAVKRAKPGEGMRYRNQATELSRTKDNRLTTREKKNAAVTETAAETNLESKSKKSKSKKSKDGVDPDEAELLSSLQLLVAAHQGDL